MGWRLQKRKCLDIKGEGVGRRPTHGSGPSDKVFKEKMEQKVSTSGPGLGLPGPGPNLANFKKLRSLIRSFIGALQEAL